jgi:Arc/MetJ family transcription regulator
MCIMVYVSRTNIDIDDDLVNAAMQRYGLSSKRAAIDLALRRLIGDVMNRDEALHMEGSGWETDLADVRADGAAVLE